MLNLVSVRTGVCLLKQVQIHGFLCVFIHAGNAIGEVGIRKSFEGGLPGSFELRAELLSFKAKVIGPAATDRFRLGLWTIFAEKL